MEENGVKPEVEIYDLGGLDNFMLIEKQGFFSTEVMERVADHGSADGIEEIPEDIQKALGF